MKTKTKEVTKTSAKPITKKKFASYLKAIPTQETRNTVEKAFGEDKKGRRVMNDKLGEHEKKTVLDALKKAHKARSGLRVVRLTVVMILIIGPTLWATLFLDFWMSRQVETLLENLSGTDVNVVGLDAQILQGRIVVKSLRFASLEDVHIDAWVFSNIDIDVNLAAVLNKRIVLQKISGSLDTNQNRSEAAIYPEGSQTVRDFTTSARTWDIPSFDAESLLHGFSFQSPDIVEDLSTDLRRMYDLWEQTFQREYDATTDLIDRGTAFVDHPLPSRTDVLAWTAYLEEARDLVAESQERGEELLSLRSDVDQGIRNSTRAYASARAAIDSDLATLGRVLSFDSETLENALKGILLATLGPKALSYYRKGRLILTRTRDSREENEGNTERGGGRQGRIIPIPRTVYPRFAIESLMLSGPGFEIHGRHLSSDPDLSGNPASVNIAWNSHSVDITTAIVFDARQGADSLIFGNTEVSKLSWTMPEGQLTGLSGVAKSEFGFVLQEAGSGLFLSGTVLNNQWFVENTESPVAFFQDDAPALDVGFEAQVNESDFGLELHLDEQALEQWGVFLVQAFLPLGTEELRGALMESLGDSWAYLESAESLWNVESSSLEDMIAGNEQIEGLLDDLIEEATSQRGLDLGGVDDLLGGFSLPSF